MTAAGGIAGLRLVRPDAAFGGPAGSPRAIPGGFAANFDLVPKDPFIHVLPPGIGFEMSTITDLNGVVGASEIRGTAHGSDGTAYGFDTDMRFMEGTYVDLDGRVQHGSFGFIWIDLFDTGAVGDPTRQQHDWEPGIDPVSKLFWTIPIAHAAIDVNPGTGEARLHGQSVPVTDYHDFFNAVLGGGPDPVPSHVSYDVVWAGHGERRHVRDETFGFVGEFVAGPATITFSASDDGGNVIYHSDAVGQYNPGPEEGGAGSPAVGHERNGVFFH